MPQNPDLPYKIGLTYCNLERYPEAIKHFRLCEKLIGKNFNISFMLGGALYMNGKYN